MVSRLPASIYSSWIYKEPTRFYRWIQLVNLSLLSDNVVNLNGKDYACGVGEIVTTRSKLAAYLECRTDEARWFLNKLIELGEISVTSEAKFTRIIILNIEDYIDKKTTSEKPKPKTDKNKPSKAVAPKNEPTLVSRARSLFEKYYQETFDNAYYWQAKDAVNMQQLLQKIAHSRTEREKPLPVDDDSLLSALDAFLHSINKDFIRNNFSVPKINTYYNDIVSEIKNRQLVTINNGRNNQTTTNGADGSGVTRQKGDVLDKLARAQLEWEENKRRSNSTS